MVVESPVDILEEMGYGGGNTASAGEAKHVIIRGLLEYVEKNVGGRLSLRRAEFEKKKKRRDWRRYWPSGSGMRERDGTGGFVVKVYRTRADGRDKKVDLDCGIDLHHAGVLLAYYCGGVDPLYGVVQQRIARSVSNKTAKTAGPATGAPPSTRVHAYTYRCEGGVGGT